jgi:magnesium transporter
MRETFFQNESLHWLDVSDPNTDDIHHLKSEYGLDTQWVKDSLSPQNSPKFLVLEDWSYVIFRFVLADAKPDQTSARELTQKLIFFMKPGILISLHRRPLPFKGEISDSLVKNTKPVAQALDVLLPVIKQVFKGYESKLGDIEEELEKLDHMLLSDEDLQARGLLKLQRKWQQLAALKRLIWHTSNVVAQLPAEGRKPKASLTALGERFRDLHGYADDLGEEAHSLANVAFSLANQRNNEVIRVLTIFSAFFLPLTFLVGVYGMNFDSIPELHWPHGYSFVWAMMGVTVIAISIWFHRRGWMRLRR